MSKRYFLFGLFLVIGLSAIVWAFSSGPPDGRAGDPPENLSCIACHGSFPLDSGDGDFAISGVPAAYTPGNTYTITVSLFDPGQKCWGFELTVLDENNFQAGAFVVTDNTNTQLSDNFRIEPDYIKHTSAGTFTGTNDGPVSWTFDWNAPPSAVGDVTFYAAGNAANNDRSTSGDYVYTATFTSSSYCEKGDANGDGTVNVLDVLTVVNHILSPVPITGEAFCRADCNADGNINVLDALGIVNVILGQGTCP